MSVALDLYVVRYVDGERVHERVGSFECARDAVAAMRRRQSADLHLISPKGMDPDVDSETDEDDALIKQLTEEWLAALRAGGAS